MKSNRRAVHCSKCGRFLFNLDVKTNPDDMAVGLAAEVRDVKCRCKFVNHVSIGIADKDVRSDSERIQKKLRQKLEANHGTT